MNFIKKKFNISEDNFYLGDIYKYASCSSINATPNIKFGFHNPLKIDSEVPLGLPLFNDVYELYKSKVLMIRIDDSPISDFIVINNDKEYEILHSYPTTLYSLFVDIDSIVPCSEIEEVEF